MNLTLGRKCRLRRSRRRRRICRHPVSHEGLDDDRQRHLGHPQDPCGLAPHGQHQVQGQGRGQPRRHRDPRPHERRASVSHPRPRQACPHRCTYHQNNLCSRRDSGKLGSESVQ